MGSRLRSNREVSDGVHARVDRDQSPDPDAVFDRPGAQADRQQLHTGHVAVLLPGQNRNRLVEYVRHGTTPVVNFPSP
jgi:hypothetical protein